VEGRSGGGSPREEERKEGERGSFQKGGDYTWKIKEIYGEIMTHIFPLVHGVVNQLQTVLVENKGGNDMETINFKDFVRNDWRRERPSFKAYSFLPVPTFSNMFLNEPVLIIAGIGALIIASVIYERKLVSKGKEYEAELLSMIVGIGLPLGAIIGALWVLNYAGKLLL
jgi:hypothetical protein